MEEDSKTYRERAVHARLGAREATNPQFRAVFERLAESYEAKARDAEWLEPAYRDMQRDADAREPSMPRGHAVERDA
jgi:hypothetical protein